MAILRGLRFNTVPYEPYYITKGGIIVFYYIDNIILAYRKERESEI